MTCDWIPLSAFPKSPKRAKTVAAELLTKFGGGGAAAEARFAV